MPQISKDADVKMNKLSRDIGKAEVKIAEGTTEKDAAWTEAFEILDEFDTEEGAKFITDDGHTLTRQRRQSAPRLNEDLLVQKLKAMPNMTDKKFQNLWGRITTRTIMSELLEVAVREGKVPLQIVQECMTVPAPTSARIRREWTKDDAEKAKIFGVEILVEGEE